MRWLLLLLFLLGHARASAQGQLQVVVVLNKPTLGGTVHVLLCPTPEAYRTGEGCARHELPVAGPTVHCTFDSIAPGSYAVLAFQDVNGNGRLDHSWLGWAKEPVGFSNDAPLNMGTHPFGLAAIEVLQGTRTERIRLR